MTAPLPPTDPSDTKPETDEVQLRFSLHLREQKAFLGLAHRQLAPGIELRNFEAELPGVRFPLKTPLSASGFRNHRCRVLKLSLSLNERALRPWLERRLLGRRVQNIEWTALALELRALVPGSEVHRPLLHLEGRTRAGNYVWFSTAFDLEAHGRQIVVRPIRHWLVGSPARDEASLWSCIGRALAPLGRVTKGGSLRLDGARMALASHFVAKGWKAPGLEQLSVESLTLSRKNATLSLCSIPSPVVPELDSTTAEIVTDPPHEISDRIDNLARSFQEVRVQLTSHTFASALDALDALDTRLDVLPHARLAVARWRVECSRWTDPYRCISALRRWRQLEPQSPSVGTLLTLQLAKIGDLCGLIEQFRIPAKDLDACPRSAIALAGLSLDARLAPSPPPQEVMDRLEPLLVKLRVHLTRPTDTPPPDVRTLARSLTAREATSLLTEALILFASAQATLWTAKKHRASTPLDLSALDEALSLTSTTGRRSDFFARIAAALHRGGADQRAHKLLESALEQDPENIELIHQVAEIKKSHSDPKDLNSPSQDLLATLGDGPDDTAIHRLLFDGSAANRSEPRDALIQRAYLQLSTLAQNLELVGTASARLWISLAQALRRREAAEFLTIRARSDIKGERPDVELIRCLIAALEETNHWNHARELLEIQLGQGLPLAQEIETIKQLARLCAQVQGDPSASITLLERGLTRAPNDPELLLPLIEQCFSHNCANRAIVLSIRALDDVPMQDVEFMLLANRAADAALTWGDLPLANRLLQRGLLHHPTDVHIKARIDELRDLADEPEHRVKMLAAVAQRQSGNSRVETLEQRSLLLLTVLDRQGEAIEDLEAILREVPNHSATLERLMDIYETSERWPELATLLERRFSSVTGLARSEMLNRLGMLYRDHLCDLRQAEHTFRLAADNLVQEDEIAQGKLDGPQLDDDGKALLDELHASLADCLLDQGRYSEVAAHLETVLSIPLADDAHGPHEVSSVRIGLMELLARTHLDFLDNHNRAAEVYSRLEHLGHLPHGGLPTLARWYRFNNRHEDLLRLLVARTRSLAASEHVEQKSEADLHIAELLEGPMCRPLEAAWYFLDAYLADPEEHSAAGLRARDLLAATGSLDNVRERIIERLQTRDKREGPALNTMLADILGLNESDAAESEERYRLALSASNDLVPALEGLGRLLARQGRSEESIEPLVKAAASLQIDSGRAANNATVAARTLRTLERYTEAESVLLPALRREPRSQGALFELAAVYHAMAEPTKEAQVLDSLAHLNPPSMMRAEIAYRRATLHGADHRHAPHGEHADAARTYLLEAVSADAKHSRARQLLLALAMARQEWSVVAHMQFLAIRELPSGTPRALRHLDLARTYLVHLHDEESAARNLVSALQSGDNTDNALIFRRARQLALEFSAAKVAAKTLQGLGATANEAISPGVQARLYLIATELFLKADDVEGAKRSAQKVLALDRRSLPPPLARAAARHLDAMRSDRSDLDQQKEALQILLRDEEQASEKLHILERLREIGHALADESLVEVASRDLIELAHTLFQDKHDAPIALRSLRELFSERGDYLSIVELYDKLTVHTKDEEAAATMLVDSARLAWTGLRDPKLALGLIRRASQRHHGLAAATTLLGQIAGSTADPEIDTTIVQELSLLPVDSRPPALALRLAEAAIRLQREDLASKTLHEFLGQPSPVDLRVSALTLLDGIHSRAGRSVERLSGLEECLKLARSRHSERTADIAFVLAELQHRLGRTVDAQRTCALTLDDHPSHGDLIRLHAKILEQTGNGPELARSLEQLARTCVAPNEQSKWLTRAAQVHLDHGDSGAHHRISAQRLLVRASQVNPSCTESRVARIPIAFAAGEWHEVDELQQQLRDIDGPANESLILAALSESFAHGRGALAREIGTRHDLKVRQRVMWPALEFLLRRLANEGPLPRLNPLLTACAGLCGGTMTLLNELGDWMAARPPDAGLNLAIGRLLEARGCMEPARHRYQLASFLAPRGPLSKITTRLGEPKLPVDPLRHSLWIPLEWRGALRSFLLDHGDRLAGIRRQSEAHNVETTVVGREAAEQVEHLLGPWRNVFKMALPIEIIEDSVPGGIGLRNEHPPSLVISEAFNSLSEEERRYRTALVASTAAVGVAAIRDTDAFPVEDFIDALLSVVQPRHETQREGGAIIADVLAAREFTATSLAIQLRVRLQKELAHWKQSPARLERTISRACALMAVQLSGCLEGALYALSRDLKLPCGSAESNAQVVKHPEAQWLLRALRLRGDTPAATSSDPS